ncbi:MAG TPA: hypothetical protein VGZ33_00320 [Acidimicrobiales bacterium]|nr:hypothetical protein [Acidimicrobiales bacterium]
MWAQLITVRLKPGKEGELAGLLERLDAIEQPGSGLLRHTLLQDVADPSAAQFLIVFESEERAREREQDPRRAPGLEDLRTTMADLYDGPPVFTEFNVVADRSY